MATTIKRLSRRRALALLSSAASVTALPRPLSAAATPYLANPRGRNVFREWVGAWKASAFDAWQRAKRARAEFDVMRAAAHPDDRDPMSYSVREKLLIREINRQTTTALGYMELIMRDAPDSLAEERLQVMFRELFPRVLAVIDCEYLGGVRPRSERAYWQGVIVAIKRIRDGDARSRYSGTPFERIGCEPGQPPNDIFMKPPIS